VAVSQQNKKKSPTLCMRSQAHALTGGSGELAVSTLPKKKIQQTFSKSNPGQPSTLEDTETYCSGCIFVKFESSE